MLVLLTFMSFIVYSTVSSYNFPHFPAICFIHFVGQLKCKGCKNRLLFFSSSLSLVFCENFWNGKNPKSRVETQLLLF